MINLTLVVEELKRECINLHLVCSQVPRGHCSFLQSISLDPRPHALYISRSFPPYSIVILYIPLLRCDLLSSPACYCCYALCLSRQQHPMDPECSPVPRKLSDLVLRSQLTSSELIPNRYIVEFDTAASLKASNMKRSGTVSHPSFTKDKTDDSLTKSFTVNSKPVASTLGSTRNIPLIYLSELPSRSMPIRI